ncbi:MAG: EexN family lipoprotein [Pseudomonadota bacterium]
MSLQRVIIGLPMLLAVLALTGCDKPSKDETVESLMQNPERIKQVMQQCRVDRASVGEAICAAAREAYNKRFMGDGKARYTPGGTPPSTGK